MESNNSHVLDGVELQRLCNTYNKSIILECLSKKTPLPPKNRSESKVYFERFVLLSSKLGMESDIHEHKIILNALTKCMTILSQSQGIRYFFDLRLDNRTWKSLRAEHWHRSNTKSEDTRISVLFHLYKEDWIILTSAEVNITQLQLAASLAPFILARVPLLDLHLWMYFNAINEAEKDNTLGELLTIMENESEPHNRHNNATANEELSAIDGIKKFIVIMWKGDFDTLDTFIDNDIGPRLTGFTRAKYIEASLNFMRIVSHLPKIYSHLDHLLIELREIEHDINDFGSLKSTEIESMDEDDAELESIYRSGPPPKPPKFELTNPLCPPHLLKLPPSDPTDRAKAIDEAITSWTYQAATLSAFRFESYLHQLVTAHYPTDRKSLLDCVLVEWIAEDHLRRNVILTPLIDAVRGDKIYHPRESPFYAILDRFRPLPELREDTSTYRQVAGARVGAVRERKDPRTVEACFVVLRILTNKSFDRALDSWIGDILEVAPTNTLKLYFSWLAKKINEELRKNVNETVIMDKDIMIDSNSLVYLRELLAITQNDALLRRVAKIAVPAYLRSLIREAHIGPTIPREFGRMIMQYFGQSSGYESHQLLVELLQFANLEIMHRLLEVISIYSNDSTWFSVHWIGPLVSLAAKGKDIEPVASTLLADVLRKNDFLSMKDKLNQDLYSANILESHKVAYILPPVGYIQLIEHIGQIRDKTERNRVTNLWEVSWINYDGSLAISSEYILCLIVVYSHCPISVRLLIEKLVRTAQAQRMEVDGAPFAKTFISVLLLNEIDGMERLFMKFFEVIQDSVTKDNDIKDIVGYISNVMHDLAVNVQTKGQIWHGIDNADRRGYGDKRRRLDTRDQEREQKARQLTEHQAQQENVGRSLEKAQCVITFLIAITTSTKSILLCQLATCSELYHHLAVIYKHCDKYHAIANLVVELMTILWTQLKKESAVDEHSMDNIKEELRRVSILKRK